MMFNKAIRLLPFFMVPATAVMDDDDTVNLPYPQGPPNTLPASRDEFNLDSSKPYVAVDALGEAISYADANAYCSSVFGTGLASVYKDCYTDYGLSQEEQILEMDRLCADDTTASTCWFGLKWSDDQNIWAWQNGELLEQDKSLTNWGSDGSDADQLGDSATPTASEFVMGSTQKCGVLTTGNYNWFNYPCDDWMWCAGCSMEATAFACDNPNYSWPTCSGSTVGSEFILTDGYYTYDQAVTYCQSQGGNLASVESEEDWTTIQDVARDATCNGECGGRPSACPWYWLGGEKINGNNWQWEDGTAWDYTHSFFEVDSSGQTGLSGWGEKKSACYNKGNGWHDAPKAWKMRAVCRINAAR